MQSFAFFSDKQSLEDLKIQRDSGFNDDKFSTSLNPTTHTAKASEVQTFVTESSKRPLLQRQRLSNLTTDGSSSWKLLTKTAKDSATSRKVDF